MDYEDVKFLDDGAVEFRLHPGPALEARALVGANRVLLFGRRVQVRFYFRCCARIARLTASSLGLPDRSPPPDVRLRAVPQLS